MRRALALLSFVVACSGSTAKVDPSLVGSWELMVPNAQGVARWVWDIRADGTYGFHAEGPGNIPAHSGVFEARGGHYILRSTTLAWIDTGTYVPPHGDTLTATGKLGTASWVRAKAAQGPARSDSTSVPAVDARTYTAAEVYDIVSKHTFDDRILEAPSRFTRTETVDPDARERSDGVIGIVRAHVLAARDSGTISYVVYRDSAAAEAAHEMLAIFDSKVFRSGPGEFVSSHAYSHRERGEARCLSRLHLRTSTTATITCYLPVQYPVREPVLIESELGENVSATSNEASLAAVQRAEDLLFAGIKEWSLQFPASSGGSTK
jgi:hypothetical protein